MMEEYNKMLEQ